MTTKRHNLNEILRKGNHSLVVGAADGTIATFNGRGIADLYGILASSSLLRDADVADKIVGKGAAALMILGGVRSLSTAVISAPALGLFRQVPAIEVRFEKKVPNIINRKGDGPCPVETICGPYATAEECLPLITRFIQSQNHAK